MNRMRCILIAATLLLGMGWAHGATMEQMRFHCADDTTRLNELLAQGYAQTTRNPNELVYFYAQQLLGTPYVAHTLEGDSERLTINIHELDCTTFVETLYALARTTMQERYSWRDYARNLENLRYRDGAMTDYSSRLHYISEWIMNNHSRGNLMEVTADLPHVQYQVKSIDFMTTHASNYHSLKNDSAMVARIAHFERGYRNHRMPVLKKSWLGAKDVRAAIRTGDFVGLVTRIEGLDISHLGILVKDEKGDIYLLDASISGGQVMLEPMPLVRQLEGYKNNTGVRVFRIMP